MIDAIEKIRKNNAETARLIETVIDSYRAVKGGDIYSWGYLQGLVRGLETLGVITEDERVEILRGA